MQNLVFLFHQNPVNQFFSESHHQNPGFSIVLECHTKFDFFNFFKKKKSGVLILFKVPPPKSEISFFSESYHQNPVFSFFSECYHQNLFQNKKNRYFNFFSECHHQNPVFKFFRVLPPKSGISIFSQCDHQNPGYSIFVECHPEIRFFFLSDSPFQKNPVFQFFHSATTKIRFFFICFRGPHQIRFFYFFQQKKIRCFNFLVTQFFLECNHQNPLFQFFRVSPTKIRYFLFFQDTTTKFRSIFSELHHQNPVFQFFQSATTKNQKSNQNSQMSQFASAAPSRNKFSTLPIRIELIF